MKREKIVNLTRTDANYTPQKVLELAVDLGVHLDCLEADWEGACSSCASIIHASFDAFYGEAENANDALMMILNDIMEDHDS